MPNKRAGSNPALGTIIVRRTVFRRWNPSFLSVNKNSLNLIQSLIDGDAADYQD